MIRRRFAVVIGAVAACLACHAQEPSVHEEPPNLHGSHPLDPEGVTEKAVIRDYLESWKGMRDALDSNQASVLVPYFVGTAHDKLEQAITEQAKIGIHTQYVDRSHDLQIIFYSPEGMSIELADNVVYDEQIMQGANVLGTQTIHARYLAVLTPGDVRWLIRIFQPEAESTNSGRESGIKGPGGGAAR